MANSTAGESSARHIGGSDWGMAEPAERGVERGDVGRGVSRVGDGDRDVGGVGPGPMRQRPNQCSDHN